MFLDGRELDGIDETMPIPQRGHLSDYAASKAEAERLVIAANSPNLETVAVRPRLIWGPGDGTWLPGLKDKVDSGVFLWIDHGKYLGSTCHVDNVVEGMVLAAERGQPESSYFITAGPPRTFRELVTAYLATAGVTPGDASVPGWLMRRVGPATRLHRSSTESQRSASSTSRCPVPRCSGNTARTSWTPVADGALMA